MDVAWKVIVAAAQRLWSFSDQELPVILDHVTRSTPVLRDETAKLRHSE